MVGAASSAVFVVQREADAGGEPLDRLLEGDVVDLLQEGEDVAALAAAEAVVEADLRPHVEAGASFVVERAEALHRADAGALQRDVIADDVSDVGSGPNLIDVASSNQSSHALILRVAAASPVAQGRRGCRYWAMPLWRAIAD